MIVNISDYGEEDNRCFVEYTVLDLSQAQLEYLDENLDEKTEITGDNLKIREYFSPQLYPFQSEVSKIRLDDFIAREEIEMAFFLSGFLEEM